MRRVTITELTIYGVPGRPCVEWLLNIQCELNHFPDEGTGLRGWLAQESQQIIARAETRI